MPNDAQKHLVIALDVDSLSAAKQIVEQTREFCQTFKVGLELFSACGPAAIDMVKERGANVFLDLKLHDIPNTVAAAVRQAQHHGALFLTVHASGGPQMLKGAADALTREASPTSLRLLAVSVLTHHSDAELLGIGFGKPARELVIDWLKPAYEAGIRGCVCSPHEAASLRATFGPDFTIVCPGVRPAGAAQNDQSRIATPALAIANGADYLVVGRPITQAPNPQKAAEDILGEIQEGLHARSQKI